MPWDETGEWITKNTPTQVPDYELSVQVFGSSLWFKSSPDLDVIPSFSLELHSSSEVIVQLEVRTFKLDYYETKYI